jgi:transposase
VPRSGRGSPRDWGIPIHDPLKISGPAKQWLETAKGSLVSFFANGVERDFSAVRNAIVSPWFNGQTEGLITRLKLIKRQMYGRAKFDLLQARLIGAN